MIKISERNWESSRDKWGKIVQSLEAKSKPDLFNSCGYCNEVGSCCQACPLSKRKLGSKKLCYGNDYMETSVFWTINDIMEKKSPDFSKALRLARKIYNSILRDKKYVYKD